MVRNQHGFTLIEVLAVLGIILLLLAGVFSYFMSNQKIFASGSRQVDLHNDLRLTAEQISRAIRYSWNVTLIDEADWDPELADPSYYNYIYYDPESKMLVLLDETGTHSLSDQVVSGISFSAKQITLLFTISGENNTTSFSLDSSVRPLNHEGNIYVPEAPVALQFSRVEKGTPNTPDPDPDPDPIEPPPQGTTEWTLDTKTLTPATGSNTTKTDRMSWTRHFTKNITKMDFVIPRTISSSATNNDKLEVKWSLNLHFNGDSRLIKSEQLNQPKGREVFIVTLDNLSIPAQVVTVEFDIRYKTGNKFKNNESLQPQFEDIQVEVTFAATE